MFHPDEHRVYTLNSVVEHQGAGLDHGHYIAFVRGFDGKGWYMFDDDTCQRLPFEQVQKRQAYLLVYLRKDLSLDGPVDSGDITHGMVNGSHSIRSGACQYASL
ncbi:hypothetical protein AB6A40_011308 [Gnathostoma spinigerum]|uniref:ubiquitinyl hydrolase 1 n=1 Tax=Gnathostoma spinigerum TaxID=75299 RepID=A0ABD6EXA5_9BILA